MIAGSGLLALLIELVIGGLILAVIWWALGQFALPEPIGKVVRVVVVLIVVIWLINVLLSFTGHPFLRW